MNVMWMLVILKLWMAGSVFAAAAAILRKVYR